MKKSLLLYSALLALGATACHNGAKKTTDTAAKDTLYMPKMQEPGKPLPANADPVCEMPWDSTWVDYTVYNNDTLRFCSENCKNAFLARPAKYARKPS